MSILFVLLTFLVVISVNYLWFRPATALPVTVHPVLNPSAPVMTKQAGFSIPQHYCFHPGHTWVLREGQEDARVGLDSFTAELVGKIGCIEVAKPDRWVRQGQKLLTIYVDGFCFDLVSPIEGVVTHVNQEVIQNPALALRSLQRRLDRYAQSSRFQYQPTQSAAGIDDRSLDALQPAASQYRGGQAQPGSCARWRSSGYRTSAACSPRVAPEDHYRLLPQLNRDEGEMEWLNRTCLVNLRAGAGFRLIPVSLHFILISMSQWAACAYQQLRLALLAPMCANLQDSPYARLTSEHARFPPMRSTTSSSKRSAALARKCDCDGWPA